MHIPFIEVPPNPFWASIGLSVSPLPLGSGMYESSVSLGYLNQSFQNAVMEGYAMAVNKDCMVGM